MKIATAKAGVELYLGLCLREIALFEDPKVAGTFAIRAISVPGETFTFLVIGYQSTWDKGTFADNLEECEFSSWPPTSGGLKWL